MIQRIAQCQCGQLHAICVGEPERVSVCHCLACKRRTGSAFSVNATYRAENVRLAGPSAAVDRQADSGRTNVYRFCPRCGSTVAYEVQFRPGMISVPAGAFADPHFPAPTVSFFAERSVAWCILDI